MAKIYLVRHGETAWNKEGLFQGQSNIDLNETGIKQAEKLRDHLNSNKWDAVYCSDLKRAVTTARIITSMHNVNLIPCTELREMNFGQLEGKNITECFTDPVTAKWWESRDADYAPQGGESILQLAGRTGQFINRINLYSEKNIMVVAHGGTIRSLICLLMELDVRCWWQFQVSHTSLSIIRTSHQGGFVLTLLNDTSHLEENPELHDEK